MRGMAGTETSVRSTTRSGSELEAVGVRAEMRGTQGELAFYRHQEVVAWHDQCSSSFGRQVKRGFPATALHQWLKTRMGVSSQPVLSGRTQSWSLERDSQASSFSRSFIHVASRHRQEAAVEVYRLSFRRSVSGRCGDSAPDTRNIADDGAAQEHAKLAMEGPHLQRWDTVSVSEYGNLSLVTFETERPERLLGTWVRVHAGLEWSPGFKPDLLPGDVP